MDSDDNFVSPESAYQYIEKQQLIFKSKAGVYFSIDDDVWVIDTNGQLYPERLKELPLTEKESYDLRVAFAYLVTKRPIGTLYKFLSGVFTSNINSLTSNGVAQLRKDISTSSIDSLKAIARQLVSIDERYNCFLSAISKYKTLDHDNYSAIYDVESGALSEFEFLDLTEKINDYSVKLQSNFSRKDNRFASEYVLWERLLVSRFMIMFVRRPSQLNQIKWCDLSLKGSELGYEVELTMPMVKQRDGFRETFESYSHTLLHELTLELLKYKELYQKKLQNMFESNKINHIDIEEVMPNLPLFPSRKIFDCNIKNKEQFLSAFTVNSSGYHLKSIDIQNRFKALLAEICPTSDRLSPDNYHIGNNRLRHTAGTTLAVQGYSELEIAQALGNTPSAARFYVDMSDEMRVSIDDAFEANSLLAKSFSGLLTDEILPDEVSVEDTKYGDLGKSISAKNCKDCTKSRPIGCYGCSMFRPLMTADHKSKLIEVKNLYAKRINSGNSESALSGLRKTIRKIEVTIFACEQAKLQLKKGDTK